MHVAFVKNDGTIAVAYRVNDNLTVDDFVKQVVPDGAEYSEIDPLEMPPDRYFRSAWRLNKTAGRIEVDMPSAREIHMDVIRLKRNERLVSLDIEQLKGNDVSAEKQALRDLPTTFDLSGAETPDELKALWPTELV